MALAYLKYVSMDVREAEFEADIGTNTCYQYIIGRGKRKNKGLEAIDEVAHTSGILKNELFNPFDSSFTLKIPAQLFNSRQRFVQLCSYKTEDKHAIALSKVVEVYPQMDHLPDDLPSIADQQSIIDYKIRSMALPVHCRSVGFSFVESKLSTPVFWQAILDVVRLLAPQIVKGIGDGAPGKQLNSAANEEIVRILNSVIDAMESNKTRPGQPTQLAFSSSIRPQARSVFHSRYHAQQKSAYSSQMLAPLAALVPLIVQNLPAIGTALGPLIGSLPQILGPIMQQAPQLLQGVADSPIRLLNILADLAAQEGTLNIQNKQADQGHMERVLADLNRNLLMQELLRNNPGAPLPNLSAIPAAQSREVRAVAASLNGNNGVGKSRTTQVAISLQKTNPLTVNGKPKYMYSAEGAIKLLLQVQVSGMDKNLRAIATLVVKNGMTRKVYLEKKFHLKDLAANSIQELELLPHEVQGLPKNTDLITAVSLKYMSKTNSVASGGNDVGLIYLADEYFIKNFGDKTGKEVSLADRSKYRVFWNKIWEGGTKTKKRWEVNLDAKYYVCFKHDKDSNGLIETRIKKPVREEESDHKEYTTGMMKSGIEISPAALNALLPEISPYPSLPEPQLKAMQTDELSNIFNSEAIAHLEMKGRDEERGYIWVFLDVCTYEVILQKTETVDTSGQITNTTEEKVFFPKPVAVHFFGEKSK